MDKDIKATKNPPEVHCLEKSFNLEELLECPICNELRKPPIFQCAQGHTLCSACHVKIKGKCPSCRGKIPAQGIRNRVLETLYNNSMFSCYYKDAGCIEMIRGDKFEDHLPLCSFRDVTCTYTNSSVCIQASLSLQEMPQHLVQDHGVAVYNPGQYCSHEEFLNVPDIDIPLALWKFKEVSFLEQVIIRDNTLYLSIVLLTNQVQEKQETEKYFVEVQLIRKGLDCAPNLRKGIFQMPICPFGKKCDDYAVVFEEQDFCKNLAKYDEQTKKYSWISRIDIKVLTKPSDNFTLDDKSSDSDEDIYASLCKFV